MLDASVPVYPPALLAVHVTVDVPAAAEVTVTVCAVFAFAAVNVREPGATVAVAVSLLTQLTVTSALGMLPNTTVNVSVCAALLLEVSDRVASLAVTPGASIRIEVVLDSVPT